MDKDRNVNKNSNTRIEWLDIARGICMILMIVCHACSKSDGRWALFNEVTGNFFLVFFFLSTGICYNKRDSLWEYVKKQFKKLMIPYAFVATCVLIYKTLNGFSDKYDDLGRAINLILSFILSFGKGFSIGQYKTAGVGAIWFLTCMFISSILYKCICNYKYKGIIVIALAIIANISQSYILLPFTIQSSCIGCMFIWLGDEWKKIWFMLVEWAKKTKYLYLIGVVILLCVLVTLRVNALCTRLPFWVDVDLASNFYSFFTLTSTLIGFVILICFSVGIERTKIINDFLAFYGKNSFAVLLLHALDLTVIRNWKNQGITFLAFTILLYPIIIILYQRTKIFFFSELKKKA